MLGTTIQPIWQGMAHHDWTEADLKLFESELQKLDFLADYDLATRAERGASLWAVDFLAKTSEKLTEMLVSSAQGRKIVCESLIWKKLTINDVAIR